MSSTDDSEESLQTCADCGTQAPPTATTYTLISPRHGWRLSRRRNPKDPKLPIVEWRCPDCWVKYRASGGSIT